MIFCAIISDITLAKKGCILLADYKEMYFELSAKVADAIEILIKAQQKGEDDYIESDSKLVLLSDVGQEDKKD